MVMTEHHGDGELLPSEALAQLNPQSRQCSHCLTGLMAPDSFDSDCQTCLNCGRCSFQPSPEVLEDVQRGKTTSTESHIHGRDVAVAGKGRELGISQGFLSLGARRFT